MIITVGISELAVSNRPDDVLVTYSLGSCVGLSLYDPVACVGGMIHCMLPLSSTDPEKAKKAPAMFTDTGVALLLDQVFRLGVQRRNLVAKVAGAAKLLDEKGMFRIGERNYTVLRKILWKNNILITGESTGGTIPRTMYLHMDSGATRIRSRGEEIEI